MPQTGASKKALVCIRVGKPRKRVPRNHRGKKCEILIPLPAFPKHRTSVELAPQAIKPTTTPASSKPASVGVRPYSPRPIRSPAHFSRGRCGRQRPPMPDTKGFALRWPFSASPFLACCRLRHRMRPAHCFRYAHERETAGELSGEPSKQTEKEGGQNDQCASTL